MSFSHEELVAAYQELSIQQMRDHARIEAQDRELKLLRAKLDTLLAALTRVPSEDTDAGHTIVGVAPVARTNTLVGLAAQKAWR